MVSDGAVPVQIHGHHLQGAGGDVEPVQQLRHSLAAGLGGDGIPVVGDGDRSWPAVSFMS